MGDIVQFRRLDATPHTLTAAQAAEARRLGFKPEDIEAHAAQEGSRPADVLLTFQLFEQIRHKLGIDPDEPPEFLVVRNPQYRRIAPALA